MPNKVSVLNLAVMSERAYGKNIWPAPQGWREEPSQIYSSGLTENQFVPYLGHLNY